MRAIHVVELAGPSALRIVDVPRPVANGDVLIEVHAVGVRFADLLRTQGLYQERSEPPYVPFNEVAGAVVSAPTESGLKAGDRVAGIVEAAGAEYAVAPAAALFRLPSRLTFEEGASVPLNYQTALFGLAVRGRLSAGETVLIHGAAGGTGTAAIQIAKALGARTIAVISSDDKERVARSAGADEIVRSDGPWRAEALALTGGRGVDVVWDPVGGDRVTDTLRVLAPLGRWLVIGFVGGPIPQVPLNRVMLRNVDVVGTYFSGFTAAAPEMRARLRDQTVDLLASGSIRPIVGSVYAFEEGASALATLAERKAMGKVVIKVR